MLKRLVSLVAELTLVFVGEPAKVNRMLKGPGFYRGCRIQRIVDHGVTNIAVLGNHFAGVADVLAIMAAETAREVKMTNIVWVRLPVGLHLGEKVGLKDTLNLSYRAFDRSLLLQVHVFVVGLIELIQVFIN